MALVRTIYLRGRMRDERSVVMGRGTPDAPYRAESEKCDPWFDPKGLAVVEVPPEADLKLDAEGVRVTGNLGDGAVWIDTYPWWRVIEVASRASRRGGSDAA